MNPILTRADGTPLARPVREDYPTDLDFLRAFAQWKDRILEDANQAFDLALKQHLKSEGVIEIPGAALDEMSKAHLNYEKGLAELQAEEADDWQYADPEEGS